MVGSIWILPQNMHDSFIADLKHSETLLRSHMNLYLRSKTSPFFLDLLSNCDIKENLFTLSSSLAPCFHISLYRLGLELHVCSSSSCQAVNTTWLSWGLVQINKLMKVHESVEMCAVCHTAVSSTINDPLNAHLANISSYTKCRLFYDSMCNSVRWLMWMAQTTKKFNISSPGVTVSKVIHFKTKTQNCKGLKVQYSLLLSKYSQCSISYTAGVQALSNLCVLLTV